MTISITYRGITVPIEYAVYAARDQQPANGGGTGWYGEDESPAQAALEWHGWKAGVDAVLDSGDYRSV